MKVRSYLIFFSLFISFCCSSYTKQNLLTPKDVNDVMNQLFEYHIDKKEMSQALLERSLKVYLKQFDPSKSYLLQDEVSPYIAPSEPMLRKMLAEYENSQFSHFFALDQKIQEGIMRARSWRAKWFQNPKELVDEAKNIQIKKAKETNYSTTVAELKERQYQRFLELLSLLLHELKGDFAGKEAKVVALCDKQLAHIENEYLGFSDRNEPLSEQERESAVISRLIKALANSLDAHTSYYSPDEAYAMKVQLEKGMCGIGVVLREGIEGIIIQDIIAGGPAAKSGKIQKGDTIVEVDGEPVKQHSFHRVLEIMKGKEGSKTILGVIRQNASKPDVVRVELIRSKITLPDQRVDVQAEPFGDGIIGKITLHSFYEGEDGISSEKDVKKAIDHLQENGPLYGLILDMRNNAGGFLSQSVKVTGLFISSGVVVISKYADGTMKYYRAVDGVRYYDGPLVVLVSRGSASATEIVAQSLQDYGVAVVVGDEQTYGKGTIQHQTITSDGPPAFFKVTIGRYYTVSGKSTQIEGVKSDIVVPTAYNFEELGEAYLEYPLPIDSVAEAYNDSLSDIDVLARKWFKKYYIPTLQQKETYWTKLLPSLRSNSHKRVQQNKNYQLFLKEIKEELKPIEVLTFGVNDLQMEEAVNIVKDMILFKQSQEATF